MQDDLYASIKSYIRNKNKVSCRGLEKKFGIGYIRASFLLQMLEKEGMVSAAKPARARRVL